MTFLAIMLITSSIFMVSQVIPSANNNSFDIKSVLTDINNAYVDDSSASAEIDVTKTVKLMDLKTDYCDTKCFLQSKDETITFLSNTFGINKDVVYENIIEVNKNDKVIENNIGRLTNSNGELIEYSSFDRGLIEYLYMFANNNPGYVDNTHVGYSGNSTYVENLVRYFTSVYPEVDYLTAISIGAAESGYYTVTYMLNKNNIYGGMGRSGLITYKNIEYGVLSYVRYLANSYYSKGINTPEAIGYSYCPTYDENGNKMASPHWLNLIAKAKIKYGSTNNNITVSELTK